MKRFFARCLPVAGIACLAGSVLADVAEIMRMPQGHVKVVAYDLMDQTDGHAELVHAREWLVGHTESQTNLIASIWALEDVLTGCGTVFVRCAPLPHARVNPRAADFGFEARDEYGNHVQGRWLKIYETGYPYVKLSYGGGASGRTKALQDWQRLLRPYVSGRDGVFLSNTWGDRNRDTRINEGFMLEEVEAAAELGVEVVQIDDGWQSGKSMNSAFSSGKGVWNGYWEASPDFWVPDPERFPRGLAAVTRAAAGKGVRFGLWFGPDSSRDAANWERDAMAACNVLPVGARPDGVQWTGFLFVPRTEGAAGYALFFRELAEEARFPVAFRRYFPDSKNITVLSPRGKVGGNWVETAKLDFVWVRFE